VSARRDFLDALADIPAKHRAWLESDDIELFAYYGWGVVGNSAQVDLWHDVQNWPPGSVHVLRWANRSGKTTGLTLLELWAIWKKWRFTAAVFDPDWLGFIYRVLHAAPLGRLTGKSWELADSLIANSARAQMNPITNRVRPAILRPFFKATKTVDVHGNDSAVVTVAHGGVIDFLSTHDSAPRIESEAWWLTVWDEFPRQQPAADIELIFDQTLLPRSADYSAPIILSGTVTRDSEYIYMDLEERAKENPGDWNFTTAARAVNFMMSRESIERQTRLSIDKQVASRSVGGQFGGGANELFPQFLLANAFRDELPERTMQPATEAAWERFLAGHAYWSAFDHALSGDDNVVMTLAVPWPPLHASPERPLIGSHLVIERSRRSLTPAELQGYLADENAMYRPRGLIVDATAEGGLAVVRTARSHGLPVIDCNFAGRAVKGVTNKEFGVQALQEMLSFGLEVQRDEDGRITDWPEPSAPFGLFRFPNSGRWSRLRTQLALLKRDDEKLRQDVAMTLLMLAWHLWKLIGGRERTQARPFNLVANRRR
jgi:hypothetical protein